MVAQTVDSLPPSWELGIVDSLALVWSAWNDPGCCGHWRINQNIRALSVSPIN